MKKLFTTLGIISFSVILFYSCKKTEAPPLEPINGGVIFSFEHYVGDKMLEFNEIKHTNAFGNLYSVATLKYFISDIRLKKADGKEIYFDMEHYVDGLDKNTLEYKPVDNIPMGEYTAVSFIFGLSKEKNTPGRFPNPPENNMEWPPPLGGGYHYMKLEGKVDNEDQVRNYQAHTGPTNGNQNFIVINLPESGFVLKDKELTLTISMDINQWWEKPNILDLNEMNMVMGNQEMQQKLHDNGMNVFTLKVKN